MMKHAWKGYQNYAFGSDELKPISKTKRNWMSGSGLAATLIDSLDTLKIMGMEDEFQEAVEYAVNKVDFDQNTMVSFFETTIRIVGGFLSAYHLDGERDKRLLNKAKEVADRLLPAFETGSGFPRAQINLKKYVDLSIFLYKVKTFVTLAVIPQ